MDDTMIYKCPNCGNVLAYDAEKQVMTCNQCNGTFSLREAEQYNAAQQSSTYHDSPKTTADQQFSGAVNAYSCPNCGAEIITDPNTAATFCTFCGSPTIMPSQLSGLYRPAQLIPFKISKNEAQEGFKKWCSNGKYTPAGFASPQELEKITGLYVPFWLFDCKVDGAMTAKATRVRSWPMGDYIYTNTKNYIVRRRASMDYAKIPADGSKNLDDKLMDLLEPYDYSAMVPFEMPYLSGYQAEKYDQTAQEVYPRVVSRVNEYTQKKLRETISGFTSVSNTNFQNSYTGSNAVYTLLPVWFHSYRYKGETYQFMMNAQTGKVVGKPPVDIGRVILRGAITAGIVLAALFGGGMFLV